MCARVLAVFCLLSLHGAAELPLTHPELYEHTVDTEEVSRLSKSGYLRGKDKALQMAKEHGGTRGQQYAAAAFEKAEGAASDKKKGK